MSSHLSPVPTNNLFIVEVTAEEKRQNIGAVVAHDRRRGRPEHPRRHTGDGEETEVISIEEISIPFLAALGLLGQRLWFGTALLTVEEVIVEEVVGTDAVADGRRELPHHVPHRPDDGLWLRAEHVHGPRTMEKEVVIVRICQHSRSRHAEKHHNRLQQTRVLGMRNTRTRTRRTVTKTKKNTNTKERNTITQEEG